MSTVPNDRSARQAKIQAAAPKESKLKPILGAFIGLVVVAGIAAAIVFGMRGNGGGDSASNALPKNALGPSQGIMLNATAPPANVPTLDIYEDYQCPACGFFHQGLGKTIDELATSGKAKVVVHTKSFLDANLGTDHSKKAANFAACAADVSPQAYLKVHDSFFVTQPKQEGQGWSDAVLKKIADDAGITGDVRTTFDKCVADGKYKDYVAAVEEQSARDGINSTPTYKINGQPFDMAKVTNQQTQSVDPKGLTDAIAAATKK